MALNFFRQRDIEKMDAQDIPKEFINYFETLDENGKASLISNRPDIAKSLGFVLPKTEYENDGEKTLIEEDAIDDSDNESTKLFEEEYVLDDLVEDDDTEELEQIQHNYYDGKDLDKTLINNMPVIEALAIPDGMENCVIHRTPLEKKQITFQKVSTSGTYGMILRVCRACHRVYLEESKMVFIHEELKAREIEHTFYSLNLSTEYFRSQIPSYEFSDEDILWIPDTWVEEDPRCPIHQEELYEIPCIKKYKDREIHFTGYRCDRCGKCLMRRTATLNLIDNCAENGIPQIKIKKLQRKEPAKKAIPPKEIRSDYIIENGRREVFHYNVHSNCYQLNMNDIVVVSDSIYCTIGGHDDAEEVVALIWMIHKNGSKNAYLFHLGYCADCQKYYMDQEDYRVLYDIGRPEVNIIMDIEEADYMITSGEVYELEREHLKRLEQKITDKVDEIRNSPVYVNPYTTGQYDDGNLSFAKRLSKNIFSEQLARLAEYTPKPYSYRVDISLDDVTETYYIGINDIVLDGQQQVISANSDFGRKLINYQTIKIQKRGKDYNIKLSRKFEINNAYLYGYMNLRTDEDIIFKSGITDPFLVRVLNMRKRQHNLTDIFVTIQENQNRIVNAPFNQNIIVQGCAGSGKTMVLLHRLSSLKYKVRNFSFSDNAMILTPNDQFTLHIKDLADELQIGSIRRCSVEQYYIEMLQLYNPDFKLDTKVSSEMIVRQDYVDYIYSDQFRTELFSTYNSVMEKRNTDLISIMDTIVQNMDQTKKTIDLSDDSTVVKQIEDTIDAMDILVREKKAELDKATDDYKKLISRKKYIQERVQTLSNSSTSIVRESIPRVYTKIGTFLSERQYNITGLEERIKALESERQNLQNSSLVFGKQERIRDLNQQIQKTDRELRSENRKQKDEIFVLSQSTEGYNEDEVLDWMRRVMLIVPDVKEEVRLCNSLREEKKKLKEELAGIDYYIESANKELSERKASQYSEETNKAIVYLRSELSQYSMTNTFKIVFDQTTKNFRELHDIKNVRGKYHRYDLYAMLLFAMRFYGKSLGTTSFMCIDEGQDLAMNEYRLLYELNEYRTVFNIYGDINQLIKPERGITDWSVLQKIYGAKVYELNENYRNTNQITRFCNSSFEMNVMQTGVDGVNVREISRRELEKELEALRDTSESVAILLPRGVQKSRYLNTQMMSPHVADIIGDKVDNGFISLMYVDEVKGIEFNKAFVVENKMSRNEKYIAYTRALSELIIVIDEKIKDYDDGTAKEVKNKKSKGQSEIKKRKKKTNKGVLNFKSSGKNTQEGN